MPDSAAAVAAYRDWSAQQEALPVFSRPAWLDIVAPGTWRAQLPTDPKGRLRYAWAYVPIHKYGSRWATLPPVTPYLGPHWTPGVKPSAPRLPAGLRYALITSRDPTAAWAMGRSCRAMATQVIDLRHRPRYDADLRRRLRRGRECLTVGRADLATDFAALRHLLATRPEAGRPHAAGLLARAVQAGLACAWTVRDAEGELQAVAVAPADDRRAYLTVQLRAPGAHPATTTVLIDRILTDVAAAGALALDLESGYLEGVRSFHARFGAKPEWYGQARLASGWTWRAADAVRGLLNRRRL